MTKKHLHFLFNAFQERRAGQLIDVVDISVTGDYTEELALEQAKKIISRPQYYLRSVGECIGCRV